MRCSPLVALSLTLCASAPALADPKQDCIAGGRAFQLGLRAEVMRVAYNEVEEWKRLDFYGLPKAMQAQVEGDVEKLKPNAASIVASVKEDMPKWRREGLDADGMAREILIRGVGGTGENWSIACLKELSK